MLITPANAHQLMLLVMVICLALSGLHPYDRTTWVLEIFPIILATPVLIVSYKRFTLTNLVYICIFFHALILMTGGAYSYARVPIGFTFASGNADKFVSSSPNAVDAHGADV